MPIFLYITFNAQFLTKFFLLFNHFGKSLRIITSFLRNRVFYWSPRLVRFTSCRTSTLSIYSFGEVKRRKYIMKTHYFCFKMKIRYNISFFIYYKWYNILHYVDILMVYIITYECRDTALQRNKLWKVL